MDWATCEKEVRFYDDGEHVCADRLDEVLPYIVDWFAKHLELRASLPADAVAWERRIGTCSIEKGASLEWSVAVSTGQLVPNWHRAKCRQMRL